MQHGQDNRSGRADIGSRPFRDPERTAHSLHSVQESGTLPANCRSDISAIWTENDIDSLLDDTQIQRELIEVYENDFSKHNGKVNSGRILMVFRSIVSQLGKANEKFMYGAVREGARARDFEEAIEWLVSAGMLNRVCNVAKMEHPLSAFEKPDQFKLFVFDTGLLKCMAGIDNSAILLKSDYQFKGPLTENYVLQQLCGQFEVAPHYYSDKNSEIDFILQHGTEIIPVEAKGGEDKSAPSFKRYIVEHKPEHALRFSARGYRKDGEITNVPLYLARKTRELL